MMAPPGPFARWQRSAAAILVLAATLTLPAVLLATFGGPIPGSALTRNLSEEATGLRLPGPLLVELIRVVVWIASMTLIATLVLELVSIARGRVSSRPAWLREIRLFYRGHLDQLVQAWLTRRNSAIEPTPPALGAALSIAQHAPQVSLEVMQPAVLAGDSGRPPYVVTGVGRDRETFATIAAQVFGDWRRWRELYEHNRGRAQPSGERIRRPDWLKAGWVIEFPDEEHP